MERETSHSRYAQAGVDIDSANKLVEAFKPIAETTHAPAVISGIGGFGALYSLEGFDFKRPVLISSTDGVGTKLKIAFQLDKHDTIGVDLVAMSTNDIMVQGAVPLFFLDYISMGKLDTARAEQIVKGIALGCREARCALIGGETAEMPGFYPDEEYDLAGFAVGIAEREDLVDGSGIQPGAELIGIASSGLHSNGFSLVRKVFFDQLSMHCSDYVEDFGRTLGEELLEPTRIYYNVISTLRTYVRACGMAHITGGGLVDNVPRILPPECKAIIDVSSWNPPAIFESVQRLGNVSAWEMMRTFNNGIGLVAVVPEGESGKTLTGLKEAGETAYCIGWVDSRKPDEERIAFTG